MKSSRKQQHADDFVKNDLNPLVKLLTNGSTTHINSLMTDIEHSEASKLYKDVRVLCWVCTYPRTHRLKAVHVKATWGRHCNKILFISEAHDSYLPTVKVNATSGKKGLWAKTVNAFRLIGKKYLHDYDWFLKADDDSYVVVENLRRLLLPHNSQDPTVFGFHMNRRNESFYMTGAGYVLSRESVKRLVTRGFGWNAGNSTQRCEPETSAKPEDLIMGRCLHAIGVVPGDSRDYRGRGRISHFPIEFFVGHTSNLSYPTWYWTTIHWPHKTGVDCCSDTLIVSHHMRADKLYLMEYLVYHMNVIPVKDVEKSITKK